jgi:HSP20 family molecular chaperone IbpA
MNIEETIRQVEDLYTRVTGKPCVDGAEKNNVHSNIDPISLMEMRVLQLQQMMQDPVIQAYLQPWTPSVAIWENEDKILVRLDLPATSKEDVDISLNGNVLTIHGVRQPLPQAAGFVPRYCETRFGEFRKVITLPFENVVPEISSAIKDGVLEISLTTRQGREQTKKGSGGKSVQ